MFALQIRKLFEECVRTGFFMRGIKIPEYVHDLILSKPMPASGHYDELPDDERGSWVMESSTQGVFALGKTLLTRIICRREDAEPWTAWLPELGMICEDF